MRCTGRQDRPIGRRRRSVTALDIAKNRLARLSENLARLGLGANVVCADARVFTPPALFDAVLLDAPCSSTGTLRRHPDVAWTKTPADIANLERIQLELLDAALRLVRPGGMIVYANCSLLKAEGEHLLARWLAANPACAIVPVTAQTDGAALAAFADPAGCLRTTPLDMPHANPALSGMDGFFAARLTRLT
ncbi:MAG: RsmB/NOP family class I SAM-dependent RNA methyltransferase [Sphingopyxis sp.]|nr:RsmB/NOP family class I SAM-dependent RNA methyltransferase [Sphingopyxis sp.]